MNTNKKSSFFLLFDDFCTQMFTPIHCSSLIFYRIMWGLIMFYEMITYIMKDFAKLEYILNLKVKFKYYGFEWVQLLPGNGMYLYVEICAILALGIATGCCYRFCSITFFILFTFLFLQEMTLYLNHFYLVCIICFVFIFLPLNKCFSVDSYLQSKKTKKIEKDYYYLPYWSLWTMKTLIVIVYTYAGIAKLNEDWLRGEPLLHWLPARQNIPIVGYFLAKPWLAFLFSYGGLFLDTFIGAALWFKKTRLIGFIGVFFFHLMNKLIFNIGIFPWVMLASTTIFFSPDWVVKLYDGYKNLDSVCFTQIMYPEIQKLPQTRKKFSKLQIRQKLIIIGILIFIAYNILMPLRHWTYPGNVNWTEEGHRWSWRMKLRDKAGVAQFYITDSENNKTIKVDQNKLLTRKQQSKISCRPELIHLFAHEVATRYQESKKKWPKVTAEVICSLNFRPNQYMVDQNFDLASVPPWSWPNTWVIPLVPLGDNNSSYLVGVNQKRDK